MATAEDILTAKLFFGAAFPVIQVLMDEDPKLHRRTEHFNHTVQFGAKNGEELLCCHMIFQDGHLDVADGPAEKADLILTFSAVEKMNALLKGGMSLPRFDGNLTLLPAFLSVLMSLKIMTAEPKNELQKYLKVKCSLYMICHALSVYNKLGDPDFHEFCTRQPDRIYQFRVEDGGDPMKIACYLRVKAGQSKSGHGVYEQRTPFVLFRFTSVDGALQVLNKQVEFVEGVEKGYVETIGSPEYACYLNDYMTILQTMLT